MRINCVVLCKWFNLIGIFFSRQANYRRLISFLLILLVSPTFAQGAEKTHIRGGRYCEIILAKGLINFTVYNTWGLNDCPATRWDKVTSARVKKETGATFVYLNGPHYWVIDGFKNSNVVNPTIKTMNGLTMQEAGVLHIRLADLFKASARYYKHEVQRQTTWIYQAGKPIYELIDANGDVFVMQSYNLLKSPQTENSLSQLGTTLKLPKGWVFKTGILKKSETVQAINNLAIIVQDSFDNTYQKATHDFL
jgi:hypothetical protein